MHSSKMKLQFEILVMPTTFFIKSLLNISLFSIKLHFYVLVRKKFNRVRRMMRAKIIFLLLIHLIFLYVQCKGSTVQLEIYNKMLVLDGPVSITCTEKGKIAGDPVKIERNDPTPYKYECNVVMFGTSCTCEVRVGQRAQFFKAYNYFRDRNFCSGRCEWHLATLKTYMVNPEYPGSKRAYDWDRIEVL